MNSTSSTTDKNAFQPDVRHFVALIAGNIVLALGPWLVRLSDTGPVAAGFWRMLLPLPVLAVLAWRTRLPGKVNRRMVALVLAAGTFFALDLASWHTGIERTRLGNATLFGNAGSIILMVWGIVALRRLPNTREGLALAAAIGGAAILMGRSLEISAKTLTGDLFCLFAGLCYAFYLIPAQRARATMGQWSVLLLVSLAATPLLLIVALALGEPVLPGPAGWTPVVTLAISSQIVGQGLLVYSLRNFSPLIIGMALLTQPAIAAAVGWLAFGETLGAPDIAGMVLVAAALVLARTQAPAAPRVRV
ncbi:EamA family transporter [Altererythrobacter sp. FM1]|uniref:DMT family transporter n=1 Tax=Tsuneonella flava TaxID=2055955 RepID=A0ABX7K960_9SPHN|nr:DMT family transporter [Tsuneonella flava]QSB44798.1 DMT family transporter [Tsuneonella flava]ROT96521.1 EamA family transporter [Altererythrobacter sp. FM1]